MTAPQLTFATIILALTGLGTVVLYPGVKKHAQGRADSALASMMTSALFATPDRALCCGARQRALLIMKPQEFDTLLNKTLEDLKLSRSEKKDLKAQLQAYKDDDQVLARLRHQAFEIAKENLDGEGQNLVDWLEGVIKLLLPKTEEVPAAGLARTYFSPEDECADRIGDLLSGAERSVDICVFTITDNRISKEILRAHQRKIAVRIITDNEKAFDRGSDIETLEKAGVPVRVDLTEHHMHHKFAVFDQRIVLTGSYNWTRSADHYNHENILVTDDGRFATAFMHTFETLWKALAPKR